MKLRMLRTVQGSPNGSAVLTYTEGSEHDLGATERERELAAAFIREEWAEDLEAKALPAPENKAFCAAPENKGRRGR